MGKKYRECLKNVEIDRLYEAQDVFDAVLMGPLANFDETVELHLRLGIDSRNADQQVRGAVVLPNGTGKKIKILVFTGEENIDLAEKAGADFVGGEDLAQKIQNENFLDFDVVIASTNMMPLVGRLGKILGPRGLMPSPKAGTVTNDVETAVKQIKAGKIEYKTDKTNIVHCIIGKISFGAKKLLENFDVVMKAICDARPSSFKGQYIRSCFVSRTMGPGLKVNYTKYTG